jgi:hypothetical protein
MYLKRTANTKPYFSTRQISPRLNYITFEVSFLEKNKFHSEKMCLYLVSIHHNVSYSSLYWGT